MVRTSPPPPRLSGLLTLAAVTTALGCGMGYHPSPRMAATANAPIAPQADQATVVVIRPSGYAGVVIPSLFVDGRYVGDVEAETKLVLTLPPGKHTFLHGPLELDIACRKMNAELEAGKIYVVESTVANGAVLFAGRPSDAARIHPWTALPARQLDGAKAASTPIDDAKKAECSKLADEKFADWNAEDQAKATLRAADGFTSLP